VALVVLLMVGAAFGRVDCASSGNCGARGDKMVTCSSAVACVCACTAVDSQIIVSQGAMETDGPVFALLQLGSGVLTQPELPPPRI
jgi:hypothetical protein